MKKNHLMKTLSSLGIVPVKVYSNVDIQKRQILRETKGLTGIYLWVNKTNGKYYVGSSINMSARLSNYFSIRFLLGNLSIIIYRALLKYGYSNFMLIILECCDKKVVRLKETKYIQDLNPEYNILKIAGSSLGYRHTEETLANLRAS